jgi:hypothetical protein
MNVRQGRFARLAAVKLIVAAAGAPSLLAACASAPTAAVDPAGRAPALVREVEPHARPPGPAGTLTDPDLLHPVRPWPLTLSEGERTTLAALCDLILPADAGSPAASALGAHEFIDEWVSAPYPAMQEDARLIRAGLAWLEDESLRWYHAGFAALDAERQRVICDTICDPADTPPELQAQAACFDRVRELAVIAHFTTREGMTDLGYVGNVALEAWPAPPPEVLRLVGLE